MVQLPLNEAKKMNAEAYLAHIRDKFTREVSEHNPVYDPPPVMLGEKPTRRVYNASTYLNSKNPGIKTKAWIQHKLPPWMKVQTL